MFDYVINPTIEHIQKLLNEPKLMRKCEYICLAGGLSSSPYFQHRMRQQFGPTSRYNLKLIIPQRPILSVVEGAAYFGITPNYIKARVLRYTYGKICRFEEKYAKAAGIPEDHILKYREWNDYKKQWYVRNCFSVLARKNEEIHTGQIRKAVGHRIKPTQSKVSVRIVWSKMEDPKTKSDSLRLGEVVVDFPNEDENDMQSTLEFHFAETVIKAVVYRNKEPGNKQIRYINNWM